jgi:isoaspartyl peptidase/L-asparaginase-like protein (Ntn-hydrolase superfamily)
MPSDRRASGDDELYLGTVGCVVLDLHGNLAAGTSTGGLMGKRWGRVGDSPIIGAGNYANNKSCAVSGTGVGEEFIRYQIAADIGARMRYAGSSLEQASQDAIAQFIAPQYACVATFKLAPRSNSSASGSSIRCSRRPTQWTCTVIEVRTFLDQ